MYIVRETFTAHPGQASRLAGLMKKFFAGQPGARVVTDFIGRYNTVEVETQVSSLAEFEKIFNEYKSGKIEMPADLAKEMQHYGELWETGRREIFEVVD